MPVQPLSYEYLSSLYTLTSAFPVCCRRAWYEARIHPLASSPSAPRRRWLERRSSKRPTAVESQTTVTNTLPAPEWIMSKHTRVHLRTDSCL